MAYQDISPAKLGQEAITTGVTTAYTVPASTRALVKDMDIANTTASTITVRVFLVPSGDSAATTNALLYDMPVSAYSTLQWTGTQVINAGDTIQIQASGAGLTISISGGEAV